MFQINKTAAGIRLCCTAGLSVRQAQHSPAPTHLSKTVPSSSVPAGQDKPAPRCAAPALRLPSSPHHTPLCPTYPALPSSQRLNIGVTKDS